MVKMLEMKYIGLVRANYLRGNVDKHITRYQNLGHQSGSGFRTVRKSQVISILPLSINLAESPPVGKQCFLRRLLIRCLLPIKSTNSFHTELRILGK